MIPVSFFHLLIYSDLWQSSVLFATTTIHWCQCVLSSWRCVSLAVTLSVRCFVPVTSWVRHFVRKRVICSRVNFEARLDRHSLVIQSTLQVWIVQSGSRPLNSFSHWQEAPIWQKLRWMRVLSLSCTSVWSGSPVGRSCHG